MRGWGSQALPQQPGSQWSRYCWATNQISHCLPGWWSLALSAPHTQPQKLTLESLKIPTPPSPTRHANHGRSMCRETLVHQLRQILFSVTDQWCYQRQICESLYGIASQLTTPHQSCGHPIPDPVVFFRHWPLSSMTAQNDMSAHIFTLILPPRPS